MPQMARTADAQSNFDAQNAAINAILNAAITTRRSGFNGSSDVNNNPGVNTETPNNQADLNNHPIVKATQKAIDKTVGELVPHAMENGVPLSHIMNYAYDQASQSIGQNLGGQQPAPLDMNSLIQKSPLIQQTAPVNANNVTNPTDIESMKQDIQRNVLQNLLQQSKPKGFIGGFVQGMNNAVGNTATNMENLKNIANLSGLSPESQYQQAGAADLTQAAQAKSLANQGNTPLQKADILAATTAAQQKQVESKKAELEAEKANLQALIKTQSDTVSHPAALLMGGQGLRDLHTSIQDSLDRIKSIQTDLSSLSSNYANKTGAAQSGNKGNVTPEQARAILKSRKIKGY